MRQTFELLLLSALPLYIGTGLYNQFPSSAYILIFCACTLLFFDQRFLRRPFKYIEPNMLKGVVLLNIFLLIQIIFSRLELQSYYNHMIAINLMVLTYAYVQLILDQSQTANLTNFKYLGVLLFLGLLFLLLGQIAQITGYIKQVNYEGADTDLLITLARPGGFLNPNVTAAIAVIFLFVLDRLSKVIGKWFFMLALPLAISVVLLAQSRAALIALLGFLLIILSRKSLRVMAPTLLVAFVFVFFMSIAYPDVVNSLVDNVMQRFEGDASSEERLYELRYSFDAFGDSPLYGNGSTYLVGKLGVSSHNEIAEILVSYGLLGLLIMTPVFFFLYLPSSALLIAFCVLPMFLFSHNFFDSTPYQVALGLALAVDRIVSFAVYRAQMGQNLISKTQYS